MSKAIQFTILAVLFAPLATASGSCPVTLLSGAAEPGGFSVTFMNAGKLPIRRLEFDCTVVNAQADKARRILCREQNALFFPGTEYTVRYPYPGGIPRPVQVSLKSVTSSDGYIWKPSQRQPCRVLKIHSGITRK